MYCIQLSSEDGQCGRSLMLPTSDSISQNEIRQAVHTPAGVKESHKVPARSRGKDRRGPREGTRPENRCAHRQENNRYFQTSIIGLSTAFGRCQDRFYSNLPGAVDAGWTGERTTPAGPSIIDKEDGNETRNVPLTSKTTANCMNSAISLNRFAIVGLYVPILSLIRETFADLNSTDDVSK